ncbi:MAG: hydroxyacid dehydrogenase [Chthoniobacterales bacterium]|nr:hydroxyacid dehydrogenase [Chthoniobacterales bacterium]
MARHVFDRVYGPREREDLAALVDVSSCFLTPEDWHRHPEVTAEAEWIFSSWSMPVVNEEFLRAFPRLRAIFYAAGTIKGFATEAMWGRGITVTSANAANAVPVAEFTVAQIILSLKSFWRMAREFHRENRVSPREIPTAGVYNATVGLISLGLIGRLVAEQLQAFQVEVIAYDPYFDPKEAAELGLELCTLDEIFSRADVVSCHAPLLKETEGMLRKSHFEQMKPHATFVNTARGGLVDEKGLAEVFSQRPDLTALLDVTSPEPPSAGSPLYTLPNVILTPHIAGSKNWECHRMARFMVEEAARFLSGEPLRHAVTQAELRRMA